MTEQAPWNHLPHNPVAFFGLHEDFVQADLKRAYGKLIRHYKPEQHPVEFQRIRAAFEQLRDALRFGSPIVHRHNEAATPTPTGYEHHASGQPGISDRLERHGATALLEQLEASSTRTSEEWCALAFLREELDSGSFLETLLAALEQSGGDRDLLYFVAEATRSMVAEDLASRLVHRLALVVSAHEHIPLNWYFYATFPAWCALVRAEDQAPFEARWKECESILGFPSQVGFDLLAARLLKTGALRIDDRWKDDAQARLSEHFYELPPDLQSDLEELDQFNEYVSYHNDFASAHPWRADFAKALDAIITGESPDGERALLLACASALREPEDLLVAFPFEPKGLPTSTTLGLMALLTFERMYCDRASEEDETDAGVRLMAENVMALVHRVERQVERSWVRMKLTLVSMVVSALQIALCFGLYAQGVNVYESIGTLNRMPLSFRFLGFAATLWGIVFLARSSSRYREKGEACLYQKFWRPELRAFMTGERMWTAQLGRMLDESRWQQDRNKEWTTHLLRQDSGLFLHAMALRRML